MYHVLAARAKLARSARPAPPTARTGYACRPRACRTYRAPCGVITSVQRALRPGSPNPNPDPSPNPDPNPSPSRSPNPSPSPNQVSSEVKELQMYCQWHAALSKAEA